MLEEVRSGNISAKTWNKLQQRHAEYLVQTPVDALLNTTHIVGFRENAQQINRMICNHLPVSENKFLIFQAVDFMNSVQQDPSFSDHMFKPKTNLPLSVRLQPGARIMYLNNSLISHGICNGTVGVITDVNHLDGYVRVAFSTKGSIIDIDVYKHTYYFKINEANSYCTQFPPAKLLCFNHS